MTLPSLLLIVLILLPIGALPAGFRSRSGGPAPDGSVFPVIVAVRLFGGFIR